MIDAILKRRGAVFPQFLNKLFSVCFVLTVVACSGSDSGSSKAATESILGTTVTAAQEMEIQVTDSTSPIFGTKLTIPKNALAEESDLFSIDYSESLPGAIGSEAETIGAVPVSKTLILTRQGNTSFELPIRVALPYQKSLVQDDDILVALYWDTVAGQYSAVEITDIDRTLGIVTFHTSHFSQYVIWKAKRDKLNALVLGEVDTG